MLSVSTFWQKHSVIHVQSTLSCLITGDSLVIDTFYGRVLDEFLGFKGVASAFPVPFPQMNCFCSRVCFRPLATVLTVVNSSRDVFL